MPTNSDTNPWAPDTNALPGKPPIQGVQTGERGTSAFQGNTAYDQNGQYIPGGTAPGPGLGISYYQNEFPDTIPGNSGTQAKRESAGSHSPDAVTNVATASSLTPVHATSVDLTATLTATGDYPITGTIVYKDGGTTLHTSTISDTTSPSVTTWTDSAGFTTGAHSITTVYSGDANYAAVTSAAITITAS